MSRAERRRQRRDARKGEGRRRSRAPIWIVGGSVLSALLVVGVVASANDDTRHPEPRVSSGLPTLMPPDRYGAGTRTADAYQAAWTVPSVLDGLYCYCSCEEHSGHRSLLDCFASDHASACDICMREAEIAQRMTMQGEPLGRIRAEIDRYYLRS